jgi:GT2 family glycosyltransferase
MTLTVVICTYLRDELLDLSLRSLDEQTAAPTAYRILVVDNAGDEATRRVCRERGADYVHEPRLGLSHARNRGMEEASTPWVLYIDDDVQAPPDLLARVVDRVSEADYAALGGQVKPWFRSPPPRWLNRYYRSPLRPSPAMIAFGELGEEEYLIGCLLAVRRSGWAAVGGFSAALGMQGGAVGRAEEDEFQLRLRRAGFRIYYDPAIEIDHLVQPYKYSLGGRLRLAYASGRDGIGMRGNHSLTTGQFIKRLGVITCYSLPFNLARLIVKPDYYWQNALVDTLTKYCFAWGKYRP